MFKRKSRAFRIGLSVAVVVILASGGFLFYRWMFPGSPVQASQKLAEESHEKANKTLISLESVIEQNGAEAADSNQARIALTALDEASLHASKAIVSLDEVIKNSRQTTTEMTKKWSEQRGYLLWLKAKILRDKAYAQAIADGKPFDKLPDSVTREKFRNYMKIAEPDREEAIKCVREAAARLPKDPGVLLDALRIEMLLSTFDWMAVERLSRSLLLVDPDNTRAHLLLARYEFEQPREETGKPLPPRERDRSRVLEARAHLEQAKKSAIFPLWRTLFLQAEILNWLARVKPSASQNDAVNDVKLMRDQLFDSDTGALDRARKREAFDLLGGPDVEGILGLHEMAIDVGLEDMRADERKSDRLFEALRSLSEISTELGKTRFASAMQGSMMMRNLSAATKARRVLYIENFTEWSTVRDRLETMAGALVANKVDSPTAFASLARMLNQESFVEGKKGNIGVQRDLNDRALKWTEEGLKLTGSNTSPAALVDLHAAALEAKMTRGSKPSELAVNLTELKKIDDPVAKAIVSVQEAAIQMREGRLLQAKTSLKAVLENPKAGDLRTRALILMANLCLALQQPNEASVILKKLQEVVGKTDAVTPADRLFFEEFLRDPKDLSLLVVIAELELALEKIARFRREFPNQTVVPPERYVPHETDAIQAANKIVPIGVESNRLARRAIILYYLRTGQVAKATKDFEKLKSDYPRSADVLRIEVSLSQLVDPIPKDPEAIKARHRDGDTLIQAFLKLNPTDQGAKRFYAEWLIRTNRLEAALAYLDNPVNFPNEKDNETKRVLAVALVNKGEREKGLQLLNQLPRDVGVEALLIRTTSNPESRHKILDEALTKHENNGLLRIWKGEQLLAEGKFEQAAEQFWSTREYTHVRESAMLGLLRTMLRWSETQPGMVIETVQKFSKESSREAMLYAVGAYAAMRRDDVGGPADVWESTKSMYAGLLRWQDLGQKSGMDGALIAMFRAQFMQLMNRSDLAWLELEPKAANEPRNVDLLSQLVVLALDSPEDDRIARAATFIGMIKETKAESSFVRTLEARVKARQGDVAAAVSILEDVLRKQPTYVAAYPTLVMILTRNKMTDNAANWTAKWRKQSPDDPIAIFESIRQDIVANRTEKARNESEIYLVEGQERAEKRLVNLTGADAEKRKQEIVKEFQAFALLSLAQTWKNGGSLAVADEYLMRSLKVKPDNVVSRLFEAQIAMERKNWTRMREIYLEVLKQEKDNPVANVNLAWLNAEHFDDPKDSLERIRSCMINPLSGKRTTVDRISPELLDIVGKVYRQAALKKVEGNLFTEMAQVFDAACRRYPTDPRMHGHLAEALSGLADRDRASEEYQEALRLAREGKGPFTAEQRQEFIAKLESRKKGL